MVKHYLLHCGIFGRECHVLAKIVDLSEGALSKLLSNPESVKALFQYIKSMGQFKRTYGDLMVIKDMVVSKLSQRGRKRRQR